MTDAPRLQPRRGPFERKGYVYIVLLEHDHEAPDINAVAQTLDDAQLIAEAHLSEFQLRSVGVWGEAHEFSDGTHFWDLPIDYGQVSIEEWRLQ